MLIRFNLGNFLSFSATEFGLSEEISMIADTKIKNKKRHIVDNDEIQLLKFAALYGKDITETKPYTNTFIAIIDCSFFLAYSISSLTVYPYFSAISFIAFLVFSSLFVEKNCSMKSVQDLCGINGGRIFE